MKRGIRPTLKRVALPEPQINSICQRPLDDPSRGKKSFCLTKVEYALT